MSPQWVFESGSPPGNDAIPLLGGKASKLLELQQCGQPVPPFYVISAECFRDVVEGENGNRATAADPATRGPCVEEAVIGEDLKAAVREVHARCIPAGSAVAVRSSAVAEDGTEHSFAGIYESVLGVRKEDRLWNAVRQVWAGAFGERAMSYRRRLGLMAADCGMAVIVQQMIDARRSGVCFTCNPVTGAADEIVIHSLFGMGEGLVSGGLPADSFVVAKSTRKVRSEVIQKSEQLVPDDGSGGLRRIDVEESERGRASLSEEQIGTVVDAALAIEEYFGEPQDIEFCFDAAGELFILQARPVTSRGIASASPEGERNAGNQLVWDNSNIIESYYGVTSPMTFSFIRRAYSIVYHCFAEVMGIPPRVVHEHRDAFDNMLGLFRGRVYYNLKNWYRLIRLFPGYRYNSRFMESMMGLKDPLLLEEETERPGLLRRWFVELPALIGLLVRSGWNFLRIRSRVDGFERHFRSHYDEWAKVDFDSMPPHEVMAAYNRLEDALLWNWKAPIINDFYVMVFYGVLRKMCANWCGDQTGALQNGLICGEGGLQSDEPAKLLIQMAGLANDDQALRTLILEEAVESLPERVAGDSRFSGFNELMARYLDEYGLRCASELKLEELSYRDEPHRLYLILRDYLALESVALHGRTRIEVRERGVRRDAERQCFDALSQSGVGWLRRMIFRRVLRNARMGVRNRENMRFARTRIYGILRSMLRSIGRHLAEEGLLDDCEDVFYLTIDEVWDFIKGTAVSTDLRGLAGLRRAEYGGYRDESMRPPDNRFVTYGMAYHGNRYRNDADSSSSMVNGQLTGVACCPGTVSGRVQVVRDPLGRDGFQGDILVAERTDPGWVPLYPAYSGILIERGSVLSHSAIVAREMGIPTIVGIVGLTDTLRSGQLVRMDGGTGTVELIDSEQE